MYRSVNHCNGYIYVGYSTVLLESSNDISGMLVSTDHLCNEKLVSLALMKYVMKLVHWECL